MLSVCGFLFELNFFHVFVSKFFFFLTGKAPCTITKDVSDSFRGKKVTIWCTKHVRKIFKAHMLKSGT